MKKCPFCAEEIQDEAIKCKHCGSSLSQAPARPLPKNIDSGLQVQKRRNALASLIAGVSLVVGIGLGLVTHSAIVFLGICIAGLIFSLVVYYGG